MKLWTATNMRNTTRNKLIKLLRGLEREDGFRNEYSEFVENYQCEYFLDERLDFPDYRYIIKRFKDENTSSLVSGNSIKAELKRMETDGLVMIGAQEGKRYVSSDVGPDDDEGSKFTSESVVLTTKGKSAWLYFLHEATENPITTILSLTAIVISIIALFL